MSYAGIQAIREGCGLLKRVNNEKPKGVVDGSNHVFVVARRPIVDSNNDDVVDESDVTVFVDGVPVTVNDVNPTTGAITLATAPPSGIVTADYCYSPLTDDYVAGKQDEADSWVDLKIKAYAKVPLNPVPGIIATTAELYAAGLILTRDWGSRTDSEQTSKDGFAKIKQARDLIADYIQGLKEDNATKKDISGGALVSATGDRDVFSRHERELIDHPHDGPYSNTDDEGFNRRRDGFDFV